MRNRFSLLLLVAALLCGGCQDLVVDNLNEPDRERALAEPGDLVSLLQGATVNALNESTNIWGVHIAGMADQLTSTNRFLSFWDFCDEPRLRLNNRTTYSDKDIFFAPWATFNASVSSANEVLKIIESDNRTVVLDDGTDVTGKLRAGAYFTRGFSRGYIGLLYDQGYVVNLDTDLATLEPLAYTDVLAAAVADLETALELADEVGAGFVWDLLIGGNSYDLAAFKEITHSLIAKFLLSEARTRAEAAAWPATRWDRILQHANQGLGTALTAFSPASVGELFFSNYADWNTFVLSDGAGYLPTDLKVMHLLDPSYPVRYPADPSVVLGPVSSDDPRAAYFAYTEAFGFLRADRRRALFTNYWNLRMWAENDWYSGTGYPVTIMTASEVQYIKAEANLWKGNKGAAAQALNDSPRGTVPTKLEHPLPSVQRGLMQSEAGIDFGGFDGLAAGKTMTGAESDAAFIRALHTEYAVELDMLGGVGLQWFFMRRYDLLQPGTALHYAIPGQELEITGKGYYTFGGAGAMGQPGTAQGENDWTTFDQRNGLSAAAKQDNRRYSATPLPNVENRVSFHRLGRQR